MKQVVYKIRHIPTGLFYQPCKGRWSKDKSHFSERGKIYQTKNIPVPSGDVNISESLVKRYKVPNFKYNNENRIRTISSSWEIVEYELIEINS